MTSPLARFKVANEDLPLRFRIEPLISPPEQNRKALLKASPAFYQDLQEILKIKSIQASEAIPLLARVNKLNLSMVDSMIAFEDNRFLRALDLAPDKTSSLDLVEVFSELSLTHKSTPDLHFLCQSTQENIMEAFSSLSKPLSAIIEIAHSLFSEEVNFTLPKETPRFFRGPFLGSLPKMESGDLSQGSFSYVKPYKLDSQTLILKALHHPTNNSVAEQSKIAIQQRLLNTEAVVYMTLHDGLDAYSEKGLWLKAAKQDFFEFQYDPTNQSKYFSPSQLTRFFIQIAKEIKTLHEAGIVHDDVKPENILVTKQGEEIVLKLCDFGSVIRSGGTKHLREATPFYAPPSKFHLLSDPNTPNQPELVFPNNDCWTFGVWMYESISGSLPFYNEDAIEPISTAINEAIKQKLTTNTWTSDADINKAVESLIRNYSISLDSLYSQEIQRAINNESLFLNNKHAIKKYLDRGCNPRDLFSIPPQKLQKIRDPKGLFKEIILRCFDVTNYTTMNEILTRLQNPPQEYLSPISSSSLTRPSKEL